MKRFITAVFLLIFCVSVCICEEDAVTGATAMSGETEQGGMRSMKKLSEDMIGDISLRHIGPTFKPGRVGDIAINPKNPNQWYVVVSLHEPLWIGPHKPPRWNVLKNKYTVVDLWLVVSIFSYPHFPLGLLAPYVV